jgi:hypothetical protein
MPASPPGQILSSTSDGDGARVTVAWFYDPDTRSLRDNPSSWTAPSGTEWPPGSGALLADNQTGRAVRVLVADVHGGLVRQIVLPPGPSSFTTQGLAQAVAPDGPYTTVDDLNGLTFDVS